MVFGPPITLTEDEQRDCQAALNSVIPTNPEGVWYMAKELAEPFQKSVIALCMMNRARRFALANQPHEACNAAAKACAVHPMYAHWYDFARILESLGKFDNATRAFTEFLRLHDLGPQNYVDLNADCVNRRKRDVPRMVREARIKLGMSPTPKSQASPWDALLSKCDLIMARDEIVDFHRIADKGAFDSEEVRQAIERGEGAYYYPSEYVDAWHTFRDYPNIETARAFLDVAPNVKRYFEICSPGQFFYENKRSLERSGWVRSHAGGYDRRE
jgi:hypothetical protein